MRSQLWLVRDGGFGTLASDFVGGEAQEEVANGAAGEVLPHNETTDFPRFVDNVGRAGYALAFVGAQGIVDGWVVAEVAGEGEFLGQDHCVLDGHACALSWRGSCGVGGIAHEGDTTCAPAVDVLAIVEVVAQNFGFVSGFDMADHFHSVARLIPGRGCR